MIEGNIIKIETVEEQDSSDIRVTIALSYIEKDSWQETVQLHLGGVKLEQLR